MRACILYMALAIGILLRLSVVDVSHVSVWCWVQRIESVGIDVNPIEGW
ncbi:MAG: hypothetical protein QW803_00475 [Candidatus Methanomethylicia archaeon]